MFLIRMFVRNCWGKCSNSNIYNFNFLINTFVSYTPPLLFLSLSFLLFSFLFPFSYLLCKFPLHFTLAATQLFFFFHFVLHSPIFHFSPKECIIQNLLKIKSNLQNIAFDLFNSFLNIHLIENKIQSLETYSS